MDCSSCKEGKTTVPYIVHESEMARMERSNKRWFVADNVPPSGRKCFCFHVVRKSVGSCIHYRSLAGECRWKQQLHWKRWEYLQWRSKRSKQLRPDKGRLAEILVIYSAICATVLVV